MTNQNKYILGTDISRWQMKVNFDAMKAQGVKYCFIRASIGNNYKDPMFEKYWEGAGKAGLLRGAYTAIVPGQAGQVAFYKMVLGGRKADFPHVIDLEITRKRLFKLGKWITVPYARKTINNTFLQVYDDFVNWSGDPIVYTNANTAWIMGEPQSLKAVKHKWVAAYTTADHPRLPLSWKRFDIWQYSADGNMLGPKFGGSSSSMDLNRMTPEFYKMFAATEKPEEPPEELTLQSLDKRVVKLEEWKKGS